MKRASLRKRPARPLESGYMEWAKAHGSVRYNLSISGVPPTDITQIEPSLDDLTMIASNEYGWSPLIERIAKRYSVDPDRIALTHGTSMANHLACGAMLQPRDTVLVESPIYDPLRVVPEYLGCRVRTFERRPEEAYRLDIRAIRRALTRRTRLVIITNPHNPTGVIATRSELEELAELAEKKDLRVLIGEVYLDWADGRVDTPRSAINISPRFVTTNGLTKVYGFAALRIGWALAEPELAARMRRLYGLFTVSVAHPSERLAARVLDHASMLLEQGRARVDRNREIVAKFIDATPGLSWLRPEVGTIGFVRLDGDVNALVERLLAEHQTLVAPGRFFAAPQYFRLGFGMDTATLEEGLKRLSRALEKKARRG